MGDILRATRQASEKWKAAFNSGDAAGCAACYEEDAVMVAKPFGTYRWRAEIEAFWTNLIADGFSDVEYIEPDLRALDAETAHLASGWRMNKASGVITKEIWALQPDGSALLREDHFEATG
jgi:ketosteroid isomerase-like protein